MALIIVAGGSGQHATVVYEAAILSGMTVEGFVMAGDGGPPNILDCPPLGRLQEAAPPAIAAGARFVVACGSNGLRRRSAEWLAARGACFQSIFHPAAIVSPSAAIGAGCALLASAIVGPRAILGAGVIVNHAASVDHDCRVGDYANIGPGARLAGCVQVDPGAFVGMNASVIQGLRVGEDAMIGAGAVVIRDVAAEATVAGVPARPLR